MQVKYIYDGETYNSFYSLIQKLWEKQHVIVKKPTENKSEFWASLGVTYTEEPDPEPTDEQKAEKIRVHRDNLIAQSDFYMMSDYPSTEEGLIEVKAYRQTLRDITKQETFPDSVTWPDTPAVLLKQPKKAVALSEV